MSEPAAPTVKVIYRREHLSDPIRPACAAEFAAVVDTMVDEDDFVQSYATVHIETTRGTGVLLGLGVFGRKNVGAILHQSDLGHYYTKGDRPVERDVFYLDFGNTRSFPPDAEIHLDQVKATLAALYELDGDLPATVEWQTWIDTEN